MVQNDTAPLGGGEGVRPPTCPFSFQAVDPSSLYGPHRCGGQRSGRGQHGPKEEAEDGRELSTEARAHGADPQRMKDGGFWPPPPPEGRLCPDGGLARMGLNEMPGANSAIFPHEKNAKAPVWLAGWLFLRLGGTPPPPRSAVVCS